MILHCLFKLLILLISSLFSAGDGSAQMRSASTSHHQICLHLLSAFLLVSVYKLSLLPSAASSFTCALDPPSPLFSGMFCHCIIPSLVCFIIFSFSTGSFPSAFQCGIICSIFIKENPFLTWFSLFVTILFLCSPWNSLKSCLDLLCSFLLLSIFLKKMYLNQFLPPPFHWNCSCHSCTWLVACQTQCSSHSTSQ